MDLDTLTRALYCDEARMIINTEFASVFPEAVDKLCPENTSYRGLPIIVLYDSKQGFSPFLKVKIDLIGFRYGPYRDFPGNNERVNVDWDELPEGIVTDAELGKIIYHTVFTKLKEALTRPVGPGCVSAYINSFNNMWTVRRANNIAVVKIGEYLYDNAYVRNMYTKVFRSITDYDLIWKGRFSSSEEITIISINGRNEYWYKSSLIPIYRNAIPFDQIEAYVRPEAESEYEHVVVNGARRYVGIRRPGSNFFNKGVQGYSTRVEQVIPEDKLFKLGVVDLYSRRDKGETPFLGWELEACCDKSTLDDYNEIAKVFKKQLPYLVICKSDSSIEPQGFETVSIPATLDAWKESDLEASLDVMRRPPYNMRSFEHESCGFHVHVSRSALSVLDLQKMERFMHNPDNKDFLEVLANRSNNYYAKFFPRLFNKRSQRNSAPQSGTVFAEGLYWFGDPERLMENFDCWDMYDDANIRFYYWMNGALRFNHLQSFSNEQNLGLPSGSEVRFNLWFLHGNAYISDEQRKLFLTWLASLGPYINKAVRYFYPDLGIAVVPFGEESITSTEKKKYLKCGLMKTTLPIGRKNSFVAARNMSGPLGKGEERYDVLNTRNTNTVEFRLFKGTMNPATIFRYLEFVDALTRFVAVTSATNEGIHYTTFIKWVITDAFNVTRYSNLVAFLVDKSYVERKTIRRKELIKLTSGDGSPNPSTEEKTDFDGEGNRKPLFFINSTEETVDFSNLVDIPEDEDAFCDPDDCEDEYFDNDDLNLDDLDI